MLMEDMYIPPRAYFRLLASNYARSNELPSSNGSANAVPIVGSGVERWGSIGSSK
jgi:hypothetical protein